MLPRSYGGADPMTARRQLFPAGQIPHHGHTPHALSLKLTREELRYLVHQYCSLCDFRNYFNVEQIYRGHVAPCRGRILFIASSLSSLPMSNIRDTDDCCVSLSIRRQV